MWKLFWKKESRDIPAFGGDAEGDLDTALVGRIAADLEQLFVEGGFGLIGQWLMSTTIRLSVRMNPMWSPRMVRSQWLRTMMRLR